MDNVTDLEAITQEIDPSLGGNTSPPTLPTSKDISEKLILDKIELLNIENHELKTENVEFKSKVVQLEKSCTELKQRSDRATGSIESVKRELQSMVIKYATSEKEVINLKKRYGDADKRHKELLKEGESLHGKIKELMNEKKQLLCNVEKRIVESATLRNENEILKNKLAQADVRMEQLNLQLIKIRGEYNRAKEKLGKIESGLEAASQAVNLKHGQEQFGQFKLVEDDEEAEEEAPARGTESAEVIEETRDSTLNWTDQYLQCMERNKQLTRELEALTRERAQYKDHIDGLEAKLTEARDEVKDYGRKVELIDSLKKELINKQTAIDSLKDKFDQINSINRELVGDIDLSKHKEGELLEYTERLTAKLVTLQSEHNLFTERLKCTEAQCEQFKADHGSITGASETIQLEYENYRSEQGKQMERLRMELNEKITATEEMKRKIDELENDIKIIKRKHISSLKELNKEIQQLKKQREELLTKGKPSQASTDANSSTLSSRTNSFNSLSEVNPNYCDSVSLCGGHATNGRLESNSLAVNASLSVATNCSTTNSLSESTTSSSSGGELITSLNDIDKNLLIERILRQQRTLNKRNEKIDFLEENNEQLIEEVRKKSKLLQNYILKEETGALATETMDKNKVRTTSQS